jgi:NAD-dependent DNA ligase
MAASNKIGHGIGEERIKQVLSIYPNLLTDYKKWDNKEFIENLKQINGWELKTSTLFVTNFQEFIKFFNSIKKCIKLEVIKQTIKGEFTDKIIVLTGFRDKELHNKIEEQGGKIGSSISKNTDILIVKDQSMIDEPTDKINKALNLNIKIITKDQLINLLK